MSSRPRRLLKSRSNIVVQCTVYAHTLTSQDDVEGVKFEVQLVTTALPVVDSSRRRSQRVVVPWSRFWSRHAPPTSRVRCPSSVPSGFIFVHVVAHATAVARLATRPLTGSTSQRTDLESINESERAAPCADAAAPQRHPIITMRTTTRCQQAPPSERCS